MKLFVTVALGGALGAVTRYALALWLTRPGAQLPWGTITANLLGALLAGGLLGWLQAQPMSAAWRTALQIGFLGALTTFSTFSVEVLQLLQKAKLGLAMAHVGVNLIGSLIMVTLGFYLTRQAT